jgi:hypothetical protein
MKKIVLIGIALHCCVTGAVQEGKGKVTPEETDELLGNPGMGWQTFHRFADEDKNLEGLPSTSAYFRSIGASSNRLRDRSPLRDSMGSWPVQGKPARNSPSASCVRAPEAITCTFLSG